MEITIALCGNPNAGKTTLFNQITGARQKVGNWPGVTVEKKEGFREHAGIRFKVVDLPGIYSLTAYSVEEVVARDYILHEKPDVVINVLDATNLERNLYLATQLIELNIKVVFAMNMVDMAAEQGISIDYDQLATLLGVPVVKTIGTKGKGITELLEKAAEVAHDKDPVSRHIHVHYGKEVEEELLTLKNAIKKHAPELTKRYYPRWSAVKLMEGDSLIMRETEASDHSGVVLNQLETSRQRIQKVFEDDPETVIGEARYGFISGALKETMRLSAADKKTISDRIDQVVTNRALGFPIFLFLIYLLFQGTFTLGAFPVEWIEAGVEFLSDVATSLIPAGDMQDLIKDGIIGGVGGVIVFLPNIVLLFLGISLFEDTGYMARAAFIMDRIMHTLGLHGKSFIPLIMGFGCNVPAIMATRTLETRRDRLLTILINPLMSCSARLPVYVLIAGAFFPGKEGNVIFAIYLTGIVLAVLVGQIFSRTIFRGEIAPFVLELPPYRLPTLKGLTIHAWDKTKAYLQKMGGVVLAFSIIIWFLGAYPKDIIYSQDYDQQSTMLHQQIIQLQQASQGHNMPGMIETEIETLEKMMSDIETQKKQEALSKSYIGMTGKFIEPVMLPLGFDWKLGISLLTGFVAKEVVVSTMGVLYQASEEQNDGAGLKNAIKASGLTPFTAFGFMLFVLIYMPCLITLITIWQETGSEGWTVFAVGYLLALAWILAFAVKIVGDICRSLCV